MFVGERVAEVFVVDPMVLNHHPTFRNSRCSACFKHIDRLTRQALGDPAIDRPATKFLVLKMGKLLEVVKASDVLERIKFVGLGFFQPEGTSGGRVKVPPRSGNRLGSRPSSSHASE